MTALATPAITPAALGNPVLRTVRLGIVRARYEIRVYFRQADAIFFTFLFPVLIFGIFSVAFSGQGNIGTAADGSGGISQAAYYLPGLAAAGILLSGVQNLGVDIANERSDGTLKRLAGTPFPVVSYFFGKMGQVLVTSILQLALLIGVARLAFGVELPSDPTKWATFAWVFLLGIGTSAVLGIAISRLPRRGKSATAVIIPIVLVLQFISGVYLSFTMLPTWLQSVANVFPLAWIARGMRSVFLPESFAVVESGGSWQLGSVALVLTLWLVVGIVVSRLTFRWIRKDS